MGMLEKAVGDRHVMLDAASQRTVFELSRNSKDLRAALASRGDLIAELREELSADDTYEVRLAFLRRSDLSDDEVSRLVVKERRTTLLRSLADVSNDPDVLRILSGKKGVALQRSVALNPATPDDARLTSVKHTLSGRSEVHYKDRGEFAVLVADSPAILSWALTDDEALPLVPMALPMLPYTDVVPVAETLDRFIGMISEAAKQVSTHDYRGGSALGDLANSLANMAWLMSEEQLELFSVALEQLIADVPEWRTYSLRSARDRLDPRRVQQAADAAFEIGEMLKICRSSSSREDVETAAQRVMSSLGYSAASTVVATATLALVRNEATPLETLYQAARSGGWSMMSALSRSATGPDGLSPRMAALLLALGHPMVEQQDLPLKDVFEVASADGFWPRNLVAVLLGDDEVAGEVLRQAPLDSIPQHVPLSALQALVGILGERTSDRRWLETALSLSSSWSGRLSELVELADSI